jgi:hypothetical protein
MRRAGSLVRLSRGSPAASIAQSGCVNDGADAPAIRRKFDIFVEDLSGILG